MNNPLVYDRLDKCPSCNEDRVLEIYDKFNRPVNFSKYVDSDNLSELLENRHDLRYMKCKKCGKSYKISYLNGVILPLSDSSMNTFMIGYKSLKSKNSPVL